MNEKELVLDQVDALQRISGKVQYLASAVEDTNEPLNDGLSSLLLDISIEVGTIGNKLHEHLKTL